MVGKTCEKGRFWVEGEKEKEGRNDDDDDDVHELPWVKCGECEGDWLVDWRKLRQEADSRNVVMQNEMKKMKMVEKWWQKRRNECCEDAEQRYDIQV